MPSCSGTFLTQFWKFPSWGDSVYLSSRFSNVPNAWSRRRCWNSAMRVGLAERVRWTRRRSGARRAPCASAAGRARSSTAGRTRSATGSAAPLVEAAVLLRRDRRRRRRSCTWSDPSADRTRAGAACSASRSAGAARRATARCPSPSPPATSASVGPSVACSRRRTTSASTLGVRHRRAHHDAFEHVAAPLRHAARAPSGRREPVIRVARSGRCSSCGTPASCRRRRRRPASGCRKRCPRTSTPGSVFTFAHSAASAV